MATFERDAESFQRPLDDAITKAERAVVLAAYPTLGAEDRIRRVVEEQAALLRFMSRLTELIRSNGFGRLPPYRLGWRRLWHAVPACHRLDEWPWRGIFVVYQDPPRVVALVFSKAPHRLGERFDEVLAHWPKQPLAPESIEPTSEPPGDAAEPGRSD